jgi:hypothetical protein
MKKFVRLTLVFGLTILALAISAVQVFAEASGKGGI